MARPDPDRRRRRAAQRQPRRRGARPLRQGRGRARGDRRRRRSPRPAPKPSPGCRSTSGAMAATTTARRVDLALAAFSAAPLDDERTARDDVADRALLIFTSGTTGLPKAAAVSHHRVVAWSHSFAGLADMRADDRMYDCLPLCHSVGGVAALAAALVNGGSVVDRRKVLGQPFLERDRALGLHDLSVHRRTLPLSRRRAAVARREAPSPAPRLRQRPFRRRLARLRRALRRAANPRVLRLH